MLQVSPLFGDDGFAQTDHVTLPARNLNKLKKRERGDSDTENAVDEPVEQTKRTKGRLAEETVVSVQDLDADPLIESPAQHATIESPASHFLSKSFLSGTGDSDATDSDQDDPIVDIPERSSARRKSSFSILGLQEHVQIDEFIPSRRPPVKGVRATTSRAVG